jgi:hypothetical protein
LGPAPGVLVLVLLERTERVVVFFGLVELGSGPLLPTVTGTVIYNLIKY